MNSRFSGIKCTVPDIDEYILWSNSFASYDCSIFGLYCKSWGQNSSSAEPCLMVHLVNHKMLANLNLEYFLYSNIFTQAVRKIN